MKMIKYGMATLALLASASMFTGCAGYIVATAPPPPQAEIIIQAPSSFHVWVPGYYTYRSGSYVWINGHYTLPPKGKTYKPGHWDKTPKGYKHYKGHWKHN